MAGEAKSDDQIRAVGFAAGTAVLMACIERATVVSLFAHWRVWAFLVLNLLLLAILFTSKPRASYSNHDAADDNTQDRTVADPKLDKKKQLQPQDSADIIIAHVEPAGKETKINDEEDRKIQEEAEYELSKEELNQRVENFIAMFRQHLVSDSMGINMTPIAHPRRH